MSLSVAISKSIYPEECFLIAAEAFEKFGRVTLLDETDKSYEITVEALPGVDERIVLHEFLNYLLDLSLEAHLEAIQ